MPPVRIGVLADIHYADKAHQGNRYYRQSIPKVREAISVFRRENVDEIVHLGDLIDATGAEEARECFRRIVDELRHSGLPCKFVLGNHCLDALHKEEVLACLDQPHAAFAWARSDVRFLILDACHTAHGPYTPGGFDWREAWVPRPELEWLEARLRPQQMPTILFIHQRLDSVAERDYAVKNAAEIRRMLEEARCVRAVFQGHSHAPSLQMESGIAYATLGAVVEGNGPSNNAYGILTVENSGRVHFQGFRRQSEFGW